MSLIVITFFRIGSVSAEPNEPGDFEKSTRMIIASLLGLMKFRRISEGICNGYVERVNAHNV